MSFGSLKFSVRVCVCVCILYAQQDSFISKKQGKQGAKAKSNESKGKCKYITENPKTHFWPYCTALS